MKKNYLCKRKTTTGKNMETARQSKRRRSIDLSPYTLGILSSAASKQGTTTKRLMEKSLIDLAEDLDDAATYARLCETDPEGLEMLNEAEQDAFEKKYGL